MFRSVPLSELNKIPFLRSDQIGCRSVACSTFYDGTDWHYWVATPDGLQKIIAEPVESNYFGLSPALETDICFRLLSFLAKRAFVPQIAGPFHSLCNDFLNLGASLAKLQLFHSSSEQREVNITRFVTTEFEYIIMVCRSTFDLLQKIIARLWGTVTLHDQTVEKRQLPPDSFGKMILNGGTIRTAKEIAHKYRLPDVIAEYYHSHAPFFQRLKEYRDAMVHHGKDLELVFVTERGFALLRTTEPFASLGVWNDAHMQPNGLASLRPIVAHIILGTISACAAFADVIEATICFPEDIAPGCELYTRGFHNAEVLKLDQVLKECLWWDAQ